MDAPLALWTNLWSPWGPLEHEIGGILLSGEQRQLQDVARTFAEHEIRPVAAAVDRIAGCNTSTSGPPSSCLASMMRAATNPDSTASPSPDLR